MKSLKLVCCFKDCENPAVVGVFHDGRLIGVCEKHIKDVDALSSVIFRYEAAKEAPAPKAAPAPKEPKAAPAPKAPKAAADLVVGAKPPKESMPTPTHTRALPVKEKNEAFKPKPKEVAPKVPAAPKQAPPQAIKARASWRWPENPGNWTLSDGNTEVPISALSDDELMGAAQAIFKANAMRLRGANLWVGTLDVLMPYEYNSHIALPKEERQVAAKKLLEFKAECVKRNLCEPDGSAEE
jgi:hypothetical protein